MIGISNSGVIALNCTLIHISKMTGKLEGFQSISTNTATNKYCQKQNTKNDPDNICIIIISWTMLKTFK